MTETEKNHLAIKYMFTFNLDDWELLRMIAEREIDIDELAFIDPEQYPAGWDLNLATPRSNPYTPWKLKLVDKNEKGGRSEEKYTYLLDFNLEAANEIMQFLKYLNVFGTYSYTRSGGWR